MKMTMEMSEREARTLTEFGRLVEESRSTTLLQDTALRLGLVGGVSIDAGVREALAFRTEPSPEQLVELKTALDAYYEEIPLRLRQIVEACLGKENVVWADQMKEMLEEQKKQRRPRKKKGAAETVEER